MGYEDKIASIDLSQIVSINFTILFLTFKILFQKENTEGVDQDQTTAIK